MKCFMNIRIGNDYLFTVATNFNYVMDISKTFFLQPVKLKLPYSRGNFSLNSNHGWVSLEKEKYVTNTSFKLYL